MPDEVELVPNLRHEALEGLLNDVRKMQDEIAQALDRPLELMKSGDAWSGPSSGAGTAERFTTDLGDRRDDLPGIAEQLVDVIAEELRRTEPTIPADEAAPADVGSDGGGSGPYGHGGSERYG